LSAQGPITGLFRRFLCNACTPLHNKLSVMAYISIYIALAIAWPMAVMTCALCTR
jgi:hypothetical protein